MGEWVTLADGSKLFCPYPLEQRPLREEESEEPNSQSWHVALALASVLGFTGAPRGASPPRGWPSAGPSSHG